MPHCACRRTHACSLLERWLSLTLEEAALRRAEAFAAAGRLSWSLWWFSFSQVENSQKEFLCMRGHFRAAWVPFEVTLLKLEVAVTSANSHTLYVFNVTFILTKLLLVTVRGQKYINITTEAAKFAKQCWLDCSHSLWDWEARLFLMQVLDISHGSNKFRFWNPCMITEGHRVSFYTSGWNILNTTEGKIVKNHQISAQIYELWKYL